MTAKRVTVSPHMLVSAVRYALGRATYIVDETVSQVLGVWPELPEGVRNAIERDVRTEISLAETRGGTVGHACDHRAWQRLLDHIEAHRDSSGFKVGDHVRVKFAHRVQLLASGTTSPFSGHVVNVGGQSLVWVRDNRGGEWGLPAEHLERID